jgi:hypothetical protein
MSNYMVAFDGKMYGKGSKQFKEAVEKLYHEDWNKSEFEDDKKYGFYPVGLSGQRIEWDGTQWVTETYKFPDGWVKVPVKPEWW